MDTQGRNLEQKPCRGLLTGSISLTGVSVNTYINQNYLPKGGAVQWAGPSHINQH